ncbi:MAG: glycosyltransferase [Flavobacteriaceae bacterium]
MQTITILYAFRNRDAQRVKCSLQSLQQQTAQNFEVVFVDYGSEDEYAVLVKKVVDKFDFASYHYIAHPGLLWNKSKALNYGILQAKSDTILINDVDVILHPSALETFHKVSTPKSFSLFKIGYLPQSVSLKEVATIPFDDLEPTHTGDTFGIGLFPKAALEAVLGFDEFFHFYGSEDEDLIARLVNAGYEVHRKPEALFKHLWHPRYPQKKDKHLTVQTRLYNAQRINQRHFLNQKELKITRAPQQPDWGNCYSPIDKKKLENPDLEVRLPNIEAVITHFLREELKSYKGKVVSILFYEDAYYTSLKYKLKKRLGKQSQPYCSLKAVNDEILKTIVFDYRHCNYAYKVAADLKEIHFVIAM